MSDGEEEKESEEGGEENLPAVDFSTFVLSLAHSTLVHLGEAPDPESGQQGAPHLAMARQTIDLISVLAEKTRGNLSGEEERLLEQLHYDLRVRFVEAAKRAKSGE